MTSMIFENEVVICEAKLALETRRLIVWDGGTSFPNDRSSVNGEILLPSWETSEA